MMTDWYERSTKALQLAGLANSSGAAYTRMLRQLVDFYGKTPDLVSEEELQDYLLHCRNVTKWSAATLRICYSGLKFFFEKVLHREWHIFGYLKAERPKILPAVLSKDEIVKLLSSVRTPHNRAYFLTVYTCGLRLQEALNLEVGDIDSDRMLIHIHRGKGAKDRMVPLPTATLDVLRAHWKSHRHNRFIFPAIGRSRSTPADSPMAISSVQGAMKAAVRESGITKRNVHIHTLRHYAESRIMPS